MKKIKNILFVLIIMVLFPKIVYAGDIRFNEPVKTSPNTYEFTVVVNNINLNVITGNLSISNGTITNVKMSSSWMNKTGNNNNFYFYHDGASTGSYTVATIEVTMTGNSEYKVNNLSYKLNKCVQDGYGNYFGENGKLVSKSVYDSTCSLSKDATLKTLKPSSGTLSPTFNPALELYSVTVENKVSTLSFSATTTNSKAHIISGSTCNLKVGANICRITVQAEAGNQKTYQITVTRKNASNTTLSDDASISNLQVHGGTLTSSFNPNKKEYDVKVGKNTTGIYFTFTTNSNKQNYTSKTCNINEATKTCKLTITAEDGVSKISYVFNILHEGSANQNTNSNASNNNTNSSSTGTNTTNQNNTTNNNNSNNGNNSQNSTVSNEDQNFSDIEMNVDETDNQPEETNNNSNETNKANENNNQEESNETIKIPIVNKEISKNIFFKIIAVVDLVLGIGIGIFITKHYKKKKDKKRKAE